MQAIKKLEKGFSLVELLVVVAIIGVLAGVGIVGYQSYTDSTRLKVLEQNYTTMHKYMNTETIIISNDLGSATPEYNDSNVLTGKMISGSTTCKQFLISMKNYFQNSGLSSGGFVNPWKPEKTSITIDNQGWGAHKRGQIQMFCYKATGGYGSGGGCPMSKARFRVIIHRDTNDYSHKSIGGTYFADSVDDAKADCGWVQATHGDWHTGSDSIDTDAQY